ncbi:MAG: hypothetical protein IPP72_11045 [Chitinophagaceae bacterium]|nr:hypothetical protein [Chitinophagaceae bacterium]
MKKIITILLLLATNNILAQQADTAKEKNRDSSGLVTFTVKFNKNTATKDGYYLGGYVVDINYAQAEKLHGKKIKITGRVAIEKGLENQPMEYDKEGRLIIKQGRLKNTRHINSPVIEIIE